MEKPIVSKGPSEEWKEMVLCTKDGKDGEDGESCWVWP